MTDSKFKDIIADCLKNLGFKKKGRFWVRQGLEVSDVFLFYKSLYGDLYYWNYGYDVNAIQDDREKGQVFAEKRLSQEQYLLLNELCNLENDMLDIEREKNLRLTLSDVFANSKIESLSELEQYIKECDPVMTKKAIKYLEDKGCRNR